MLNFSFFLWPAYQCQHNGNNQNMGLGGNDMFKHTESGTNRHEYTQIVVQKFTPIIVHDTYVPHTIVLKCCAPILKY